MKTIVKVVALATGGMPSQHENKYVAHWSPHTKAGICELETTTDPDKAKRFDGIQEIWAEWKTVSDVEAVRPWDGKPNRPLTGISFSTEAVAE